MIELVARPVNRHTPVVESGGPGAAQTAPDLPDNLRGGAEMADRTCSVDGCDRSSPLTRGWCHKHYERWRVTGNPLGLGGQRKRRPVNDRFWEKVDQRGDGCWEWTAALDTNGYGHFIIEGRNHAASRVAWMLTHGPIDAGLFVCHRCDNPPCCRPDHLFLGTALDNARDAVAKGRQTGPALKTHCKYGHPFDAENTYVTPSTGKRRCRTCLRNRRRAEVAA